MPGESDGNAFPDCSFPAVRVSFPHHSLTIFSMRHSSIAVPLVSMLAIAALGQGCGPFGQRIGERAAERAIERSIEQGQGGDVQVDYDSDSWQIQDQEGRSLRVGAQVEFPENFPSDIPRYQNGTLAFVSTDESSRSFGYSMETPDAKRDVAAWFRSKAESMGYAQTASFEVQDSIVVSYERNEGEDTRVLSITIADAYEGGSNIVVASSIQ